MIVPYRIFQPTTRILSATSAPDLLHWVTHSLDLGSTYLLVDLRDVMFMDSSGLGALVIAKNELKKRAAPSHFVLWEDRLVWFWRCRGLRMS